MKGFYVQLQKNKKKNYGKCLKITYTKISYKMAYIRKMAYITVQTQIRMLL